MTTETAAADPEVTQSQTEEVTPPAPDEESAAAAVPPEGGEQPASAEAAAFDFDSEFDSALKSEGIEPSEVIRQPGKSRDQLRAESITAYQSERADVFQNSEGATRAYLEELGLSNQQAHQVWQTLRNAIVRIDNAHLNRDATVIEADLRDLEGKDAAAFKVLTEGGRVYQNSGDLITGLVAAGRKAERAALETEGWMSPAKAKKVTQALIAKATATAEQKAGRKSGEDVSGRSTNGLSEDEQLLDPDTPIERIQEILARRNGG